MARSLRILLTNFTLAGRTGTEIVTRDFALGLLRRGHAPVAFSPRLGPLAEELRAAGVPVIDRLDRLAIAPDLVHGNHHCQLLAAMLRFPNAAGVLSCHDWQAFHSVPLSFPRIGRYVAVDQPNFDLLTSEHGIAPARVRWLPNAVDLRRFAPREPLPPAPRRALAFNNNIREDTGLSEIRAACAAEGLRLDVIGAAAAQSAPAPESLLPSYDLVFAVARSALEALAVGCAVILCDHRGLGPMVTGAELDDLRRANFGFRALHDRVTVPALRREIARYDAADSMAVHQRVRAEAGLEAALDALLTIYDEAIESVALAGIDSDRERIAVSEYLELWERRVELAMWREQEARQRAERAECELATRAEPAIASPAVAPSASALAPAPSESRAADPARSGAKPGGKWLSRLRRR